MISTTVVRTLSGPFFFISAANGKVYNESEGKIFAEKWSGTEKGPVDRPVPSLVYS